MAGIVETELKLSLVQADDWRELLMWPGWCEIADPDGWQLETLEAQYFDTADYDLRQAKMAYRIRKENGRWVAAVKGGGSSAGGLHRRHEWEAVIDEPVPHVGYFATTDIGDTLSKAVNGKPLKALFTTCFERYTLEIRPAPDTLIEVALDRGAILAGSEQAPIQEVELELKTGSLTALLALGARLSAAFPLRFEEKSKYYRGLLAAGLAEKSAKPKEEPISGSQRVTAGAKQLVIRCLVAALREYTQNTGRLDDAERLHQARIKLRKLRAALSFVRPLIEPESYGEYQSSLRNAGKALEAARELDMLAEAWRQVQTSGVLLQGRTWLADVLASERSRLLSDKEIPFDPCTATPLFLRLWSWLEDDIWFEPPAQAFRGYCTARLDEWYRQMLEFGKKPALDDIQTLRELRKTGKKLRYVLERLEGVLGGSADDLLERLEQLQDALGEIRDARQTAEVLTRLMADKSSRALQREAGILMGWQARGALEKQKSALKAWRRVRRRLLKRTKEVHA